MKKWIKYILPPILIVITIFVTIMLLAVGTFNQNSRYISGFKENEEGFEYVVQYIIDLKEDYGEEFKMYWDGNKENRRVHIVNSDMSVYIKIDEQLKENIGKINEGFRDQYWEKTYITKQGITFSIEGNWYAFIYTFNEKKPEYMLAPDEDRSIKSKPIGKNWYFVESK